MFAESFGVPHSKQYNWSAKVTDALNKNLTTESQWSWSIVLALLNQILAPAADMPVPRLVFLHDDYHDAAFRRLLLLLGVPFVDSMWTHNWPAVSLSKPARSQNFKCTLEQEIKSRSRRGTYQVVCPESEIMLPKNIAQEFKCVIPDFLRWLTSKDLKQTFDETTWSVQVLNLFAQWAAERNLRPIFGQLAEAAKAIKTL